MPLKCEIISCCSPIPYRSPRTFSANQHQIWRFTAMHLKTYPKPQDKKPHPEGVPNGTENNLLVGRGTLRTEWGVRQAHSLLGSPGNGTVNRCPLSIISSNTIQHPPNSSTLTAKANGAYSYFWSHKSKTLPDVGTLSSSVVLLSSSCMANEGSLKIYQGEDGEGTLDIWAVIKPGNTKEKIAIFTAQKCNSAEAAKIDKEQEKASDFRTVSLKSKGCWDGEWSVAKRRKRSGTSDKTQCSKAPAQNSEHTNSYSVSVGVNEIEKTDGEEFGKMLSVVEMVAYLEQRASEQQVELIRPALRGSKGVPTFQQVQQICKAPLLAEIQDEEESVRVLDMVAKLESQCLNRPNIRAGDLSRSNSFRRRVGRVLLAGTESYSVLLQPTVPNLPNDEHNSDQKKLALNGDEPTALLESCSVVQTKSSEWIVINQVKPVESRTAAEQESCADAVKDLSCNHTDTNVCECSTEPPPGMLFFDHLPPQTPEQTHFSASKLNTKSKNTEECFRQDNKHEGTLPLKETLTETAFCEGQVNKQMEHANVAVIGEIGLLSKASVPLRHLVSHTFLETRFKIQLLLEPQQYMAFLPHHIIVKIFSLLPTESLAALKCTCPYFKFIIEQYGIRPADSLWVNDPRYKEDPCKQCKKRYSRGDVSLCRWHHKPYCQALPYGPGYWMCCREAHKDAPGCNVGLHDNRWVPVFHSISMPMYRRSRERDDV